MKSQVIFDTTHAGEEDLAKELLNSLIEYNLQSRSSYLDIHIYQEESSIIIEWAQVFYDGVDYGEHFVLIDEEHCVVKEVILPDSTIVYAISEEDERQIRKDWEIENNSDTGGID